MPRTIKERRKISLLPDIYSDTLDTDISVDVPERRLVLFGIHKFDVPVRPIDAKWLKEFVTLAKQLCTQINSVSVIASAEDYIKSTLTQKLPKPTYEQIVNRCGKFDFSLAELFKGIEFAINLFEPQQVFEGESVTVRSASHKPHTSGNKSSANKRKGSRNSSDPKNCQLCQGDHKPAECTKYKSRDSRRERVLKLNLCFNCLSTKHKSKFCKSKYSCPKCHNRHHTATCSDLVESGQRQSTRSVVNPQHSNGSIANNSQAQGAISSEFS